MNIVVCIKQVPDVPTIRMDRRRMTIIREGVESVVNPLDTVALDAALELTGRQGGTVTAVTMGPPQSEAALREALAMGAHHAILLTDPRFAAADTLATSHVLASAVKRVHPFPDLIFCGKQTIDSDTGHVGPQIAEELGLPQVCGVFEIHSEPSALVVKRVSDGFLETLRVGLPALLTFERGRRPLRHIPLGSLESAFSQAGVACWDMREMGLEPGRVGLEGSATQVRKLRSPPPRRKGDQVAGSPGDLARAFMNKLASLTMLDEDWGER